MDSQTQRELQRITQNTPKHLGEKLMRKEVDTRGEEFAKAALKSKTINPEMKKTVRKLLDIGAFKLEEEVVDEDVVKQLEDYNEREILKSKESGKLADPKKDRFYKQRMRDIRASQR